MKITAEQLIASGRRVKVVDLDTGLVVRKVTWINLDPVPSLGPGIGVLEAIRVDQRGEVVRDRSGDVQTYFAKGRFKIVDADPMVVNAAVLGAPTCVICRSPATVPGDDLCHPCRARDRAAKNPMRAEKIDDPFADHKCCHCSRKATWSTSDESTVTPSLCGFTVRLVGVGAKARRVVVPDRTIGGKQQWQRAVTVGRRYFCDRHYKPPRLLDADGEPMRDLEVTNRPQ